MFTHSFDLICVTNRLFSDNFYPMIQHTTYFHFILEEFFNNKNSEDILTAHIVQYN